jgi:hypothetical protein
MNLINDSDVWIKCPVEHLWIYDKLILAKKLGYTAGPAGVCVPEKNWYVVRPITNCRMMGLGAYKAWLVPDKDSIPDGYFWCEWFDGRHITIDYNFGVQNLTAEGIKFTNSLNRFSSWEKINYPYKLPDCLQQIANVSEWLNIEIIGNKIIEVHLRYNDDFLGHTGNTIWPVWKDHKTIQPPNTQFIENACGSRLGFWYK